MVMVTSQSGKEVLDSLIGRCFFAYNWPFQQADSATFKAMVSGLRPGYRPPSGRTIGSTILQQVLNQEKAALRRDLSSRWVTLAVDAWSGPLPVLGLSLDGELVQVIETDGIAHTAEYMASEVKSSLLKLQVSYDCNVAGVVCDLWHGPSHVPMGSTSRIPTGQFS